VSGFEANRSIQLSYGLIGLIVSPKTPRIIKYVVSSNTKNMSAAPRYREIEIKLAYSGTPESARAMLEQHGYTLTEPRTLEADQVFDRARELRDSDQLLRLRQTRRQTREQTQDRALVTYKGPGAKGIHKSREEIEFDVSDPEAFALVLERLGYYPSFRYEKYRTKFASAGEPGFITIDETPIGVFLELEGAPEWIDQTAARLGYPPATYLTCSYASLYREFRLAHPGESENMTFSGVDLSRTAGKRT
jgi:adenylate cyclase class 2